MPQLSPRRLWALEEALGHVERLLGEGSSPGGLLLDGLPRQLDGTRQVCAVGWGAGSPPFVTQKGLRPLSLPQRMELDNFWKQLQELEQRLDQLSQADVRHHDQLAGLSRNLGGLNQTTSHLQILLSTIVATGFGGKSIRRGLAGLVATIPDEP